MKTEERNESFSLNSDDSNRPDKYSKCSWTPGELILTNLNSGVTGGKLRCLFEEFGPLIKYQVNYNERGCSLGSGTVIFSSYTDALKAMKKYNGHQLEGRAMEISIAPNREFELTIRGAEADPNSKKLLRSCEKSRMSTRRELQHNVTYGLKWTNYFSYCNVYNLLL